MWIKTIFQNSQITLIPGLNTFGSKQIEMKHKNRPTIFMLFGKWGLKFLLVFGGLICSISVFSQSEIDTILTEQNAEEIRILAGYNLNFGFNGSQLHIMELGVAKIKLYPPGFHPVGNVIYFSNEFIYSNDKLIIGPKLGAYVYLFIFVMGIETIYYTDFSGQSIRLSPYLGIGSAYGKLSLNFPVNLYKYNFDYINPITLNLSVSFVTIWKRKYNMVSNFF